MELLMTGDPWGDPWSRGLVGQTLGGYRLTRFIDSGFFSLVFEVSAPSGATFAMKVLRPGTRGRDQLDFENEGVLLRRMIGCSSVINLVDTGSETLDVAIAGGGSMPLPVTFHVLAMASGHLGELLRDPLVRDQLAWRDRLNLWRGAVRGVHQMHLQSVVHRDLKSSNCLLVVSGSRSEVRMSDLGRSRDCRRPASRTADQYVGAVGEVGHAAPEHLWFQGGATFADFRNADIYGVGSLLVELATGHPMTSLVMTTGIDVSQLGIEDYQKGIVRDLATLRPQFHEAIDAVVEDAPVEIRRGVALLLRQLCDPVPEARLPLRIGRRVAPADGLVWLLRRVDILRRQLEVEPRRVRYRRHNSVERTA